ncbi:cytoplasmic protein [Cylindrobasidium torrendii FP15055 ss-10]|uniref:GPN-loop GTPase 2 n=1 Tax=Cylindrobasidium torrendii FP15055 ss-10 TaxID=1314674 RepID=A0A0D7B4X6_9AGAR|nr:cytoplasmic protein [Cylindrobasidium torrendii FP15055 ss-10]
MPFGEIVCGSPGSGKSTYCHGKHQLFTALKRPIFIVNLDPANDNIPYPCAIDIADLVSLSHVQQEYGLGPNGGMLFCMEYLEANYDWLEEKLQQLGNDAYVLFDIPGQVELSTNHESLKRIISKLTKTGFRLAAIHLCDAHYITDASKYVSVVLLSLRAMLHLELPHINVFSKIDLISNYGDLDFNLNYYTEVQDLNYLDTSLEKSCPPRFAKLNMTLIDILNDHPIVGFETLAVEDKTSMMHLTRLIDRVTGYVFVPPPDAPVPNDAAEVPRDLPPSSRPNVFGLFSTAVNAGKAYDVLDIQERWIDSKDEYDAWEKEQWKKEGEALRTQKAAGA